MSEMSTCKHCGDSMRAKGANNMTRAFCSSRCAGDYRRAINAQRRAEAEAEAEAKLDYNRRIMARYMNKRRARLARLERNTRLLDSYLQERRARLARLKRRTA